MNVPNLPAGKIVDENGYPTDQMLTFLQNLVTGLLNNIGDQSFVLPTQTSTQITLIQDNTVPNPSNPNPVFDLYTCQFGTGFYNSTANTIMFCVDNGDGFPLFKTATLT